LPQLQIHDRLSAVLDPGTAQGSRIGDITEVFVPSKRRSLGEGIVER
jgi:hypothetical protein